MINGIIFLDAGHGGGDHGASSRKLMEKDVNLTLCGKLHDEFLDNDFLPVMTRATDHRVNLKERCAYPNGIYKSFTDEMKDLSIFVSIHCNADPDEDEIGMPEAFGKEIWYYKAGLDLAYYLKNHAEKIFPDERFRGTKKTDELYVLWHTLMPAILIEVGFIDRVEMNEKLRKNLYLTRLTKWVVAGVTEYLIDVKNSLMKEE